MSTTTTVTSIESQEEVISCDETQDATSPPIEDLAQPAGFGETDWLGSDDGIEPSPTEGSAEPQPLPFLAPPQRLFADSDWGMDTPNAQSRRAESLDHLGRHLETIGDEMASAADRKEASAYLLRYSIDLAELVRCSPEIDQALARSSVVRGMSQEVSLIRAKCRSAEKAALRAQEKAEREFGVGDRAPAREPAPVADWSRWLMTYKPIRKLLDRLQQACLPPKKYTLTGDGEIVREGEPNDKWEVQYYPVATRGIVLVARAQDVDTAEHHREVAWLTDHGEIASAWFERAHLMESRKVIELARLGAPVVSTFAGELARYMDALDSTWATHLPIERISTRCGWVDGEGGGFVLGSTFIPNKAPVTGATTESTTQGEPAPASEPKPVSLRPPGGYEALASSIHKEGSHEKWLEAWGLCQDRPIVRLAVYTALASLILKQTVRRGCVIDLWGRSSIGKTTTLILCASIFGDPMHYIGKWSSTLTYRERSASMLHCLPHMLDDTRQLPAKERELIGQTVYILADGQGKGRGFVFGAQKRAEWCSFTFSTGESPLLGTSQDEGARARCLSVEGAPFGDRETAARVAMLCERNFGHFAELFIQEVMQRQDFLADYYDRFLTYWVERLSSYGPIAMRLAAHVAAIDVAGQIANIAGLPFPENHESAMECAFRACVASSEDADKPLSALRAILTRASAMQASFFGRHAFESGTGEPKQPPQGWLGRWDKGEKGGDGHSDWKFVGVATPIVRKWLKEDGYDVGGILAQWEERGWLLLPSKKQSSTYDKPVRVDGQYMRLVCFVGSIAHQAMAGDDTP